MLLTCVHVCACVRSFIKKNIEMTWKLKILRFGWTNLILRLEKFKTDRNFLKKLFFSTKKNSKSDKKIESIIGQL